MLPARTTHLVTSEASVLAGAQAERGRVYVRTTGGAFRGELDERSDGTLALLRERWSAPLRVRCNRARDYVAFSAVLAEPGSRWCGVPLGHASALEIDRDWEITTRGALESCSFAVRRSELERVEGLLAGGAPERAPNENRALLEPAATALVAELRSRVEHALALGELPPEAERAQRAEFVHLAARLRRGAAPVKERPESFSRRRRAVRAIEEYLEAHEREVPSLADLCALTGASERTLEYAFREQVGVTPNRYLRLRRLNLARKELCAGEPVRVTDVAMRWGFCHLGRFASDYQQLFGERPSETVAALHAGAEESAGERGVLPSIRS
jgi:AraC family transcriptional regulator, ethanolamine operon transcriptional activator